MQTVALQLAQAIAADHPGVVAPGEDQSIARTQLERTWHAPQYTEPGDQSRSGAAAAVVALPLRDRCQPSNCRV